MTEPDEDALWRSIVENYGDRIRLEPDPERPDDPDRGDQPGRSDRLGMPGQADRYRDTQRGRPSYADEEPDVLDAWDDPEDHFVPPAPPPLPRPEPPRLLAWAGVFGIPVLTILLSVAHVSVPAWASLLGLAWFVGGFGYLVATMRRDDEPDQWDDGAVL